MLRIKKLVCNSWLSRSLFTKHQRAASQLTFSAFLDSEGSQHCYGHMDLVFSDLAGGGGHDLQLTSPKRGNHTLYSYYNDTILGRGNEIYFTLSFIHQSWSKINQY